MALFLLIYISVYGGIHLYALIKLRKGFVLGATPVSLMALFMLLMVVAPIVTRITERWGYEALSRGLAYIAFIWMGLLFVFISSSFFFDVYRGLLYLAKALSHRPLAAFSLSSRTIGTITLLFSIAAATYGYFEALTIRTEKIAINTDKLPANIDRLRIVQISDVHLGVIVGAARFKRIINKVVSAQPDLLVSTGDLVDGPMADAEALIELIQRIPATYGKFAVTGNHEFYSGLSQSMAFTEKAGFTVLRGEGVTIADTLNIVGVDDPARGYRELKIKMSAGRSVNKRLMLQ